MNKFRVVFFTAHSLVSFADPYILFQKCCGIRGKDAGCSGNFGDYRQSRRFLDLAKQRGSTAAKSQQAGIGEGGIC